MCHVCKQTFSASQGTLFYRLRTDPKTVLLVIALLVYGCPLQAIVQAFGFDERTVRNWWQRAGEHCQDFHERLVMDHQLDLGQVQADEIKVKTQNGLMWMAMAIMVSTRLYLGGAVSAYRDTRLLEQMARQVRAIALCRPLLLAVDGLNIYLSLLLDAFRTHSSSARSNGPNDAGPLAQFCPGASDQIQTGGLLGYPAGHRAR